MFTPCQANDPNQFTLLAPPFLNTCKAQGNPSSEEVGSHPHVGLQS